jgi:hypothetical protein
LSFSPEPEIENKHQNNEEYYDFKKGRFIENKADGTE